METLPIWEIALRLLAAFGAGAVVGWERESRGRPAGFRTTILACTAAAASMVISDLLYASSAAGLANSGGNWRPDPARLGAGILTGIGFLGAGTIMRHENFVRGVTTAASLWFVTVVGLAFGSGLFVVGAFGVAIAVITLFLLPLVERHIPSDWYATVKVTIADQGISDADLLAALRARGTKPTRLKSLCDVPGRQRTLQVELKCKRPHRFELCSGIVQELSAKPGVTCVSWE